GTVPLDDVVDQRFAFDEFLVVAEQARDGGGDGFDLTCRLEKHDDARRIVDEGPEPTDLVVGHFPAPAFGEVADAEHQASDDRVGQAVGGDDLDELPTLPGAYSELDRCADGLALDARERDPGQLLVIAVDD